MTNFGELTQAFRGEEGLAELRAGAIRSLALAILALALGGVWLIAILQPEDYAGAWLLVGGLALVGGCTHAALRGGPLLAAAAMVLGLTGLAVAAVHLFPAAALGSFLCLVVVAAAGTGGWRNGVGTATVCSAAVLLVGLRTPDVLPPPAAGQALFTVWVALLVAWIAMRQLRTAAQWAWSSYTAAQEKVEEVRARQAELARLSKTLDVAYDRLQRLHRELTEAQAAAEEGRRLKAEFAATVGHELRTPVNLIVGLSELLFEVSDRARRLPEDLREDLAIIHRNALHVSQLVDDILDLSQVDARRLALHKERVGLPEIVRQAADSVAGLYGREGLSLIVCLPPDLPSVLADPVRVRQVLINLLYNAARFTSRGGVTVSARSDLSEVVVAVADTGVGIPPSELPRLFEEFRQAGPAARGRAGSGFGLAVCKSFVELHGGSIWAISSPGTGSTFYFSLPLQESVVAGVGGRGPAPARPEPLERPRLAVLDETGEAARLLQRYMDAYEVVGSRSWAEVGRLAEDAGLRAAVVVAPSGPRTWREACLVRPQLARLPVVFCPLRTRSAVAQELGVAAYLSKPISRRQLAHLFRRFGRPVRRIVVVEDDDEMRALLVRMVESLSPRYRVRGAVDGEAGLRLVRDERPDVLLLDLLLPGIDGHAVLEQLRAAGTLRRTTVIVVSGAGTDEHVVANALELRRESGLSVAELTGCLKAILDALVQARPGTAPAPRASFAG